MAGKIIVKNAVVRKPGYMYYINGSGDICESKMAHGRKKKPATVKIVKRKPKKVKTAKKSKK